MSCVPGPQTLVTAVSERVEELSMVRLSMGTFDNHRLGHDVGGHVVAVTALYAPSIWTHLWPTGTAA
jgi:hypothetical protein